MDSILKEKLEVDKSKFKKNKNTRQGDSKITKRITNSKNPSKQYRDRLNRELENLTCLLPVPDDLIRRLDKLSALRLAIGFIKNKQFQKGELEFHEKNINSASNGNVFWKQFKQGFNGFILVVTLDGEIFFVSDNVKKYLGYSQWQILHQPIEVLLENEDQESFIAKMKGEITNEITTETEDEQNEGFKNQNREFIVRLKSCLDNSESSDMYKPFRLNGTIREIQISFNTKGLALFGLCSPLRTNMSILEIPKEFKCFDAKHQIDFRMLELDQIGKEVLGYSPRELSGRMSWQFSHSQDVWHIRCTYSEAILTGQSTTAIIQLKTKKGEWAWIQFTMRVIYKNEIPDFIISTNVLMSENDAKHFLEYRPQSDEERLKNLGLNKPLPIAGPTSASKVLKIVRKYNQQTSKEPRDSITGESSLRESTSQSVRMEFSPPVPNLLSTGLNSSPTVPNLTNEVEKKLLINDDITSGEYPNNTFLTDINSEKHLFSYYEHQLYQPEQYEYDICNDDISDSIEYAPLSFNEPSFNNINNHAQKTISDDTTFNNYLQHSSNQKSVIGDTHRGNLPMINMMQGAPAQRSTFFSSIDLANSKPQYSDLETRFYRTQCERNSELKLQYI